MANYNGTHTGAQIDQAVEAALNGTFMQTSVYDPQGIRQDIFQHTDNSINAHNTSATAHADIRALIGQQSTESTEHSGCFYRMVNGVQEWLNPPMELGVEYKTTERYMGKPVYARVVDLGNLPNASGKTVTVDTADIYKDIFLCTGVTSDQKPIPTLGYGTSNIASGLTDAILLTGSASGGLFVIVGTQQDRSSATATALIKYTKTTD